ncbi:zinc ribbon domain-containing protein [Lysinibacillus louembei]|uniref:Zinc ribbon domain-containing protein n=1 Tax=Lysinibacillus louembei TaxID=1470088 RepID=A0ABZ0RQA0_9BACI|nr:zinc ribbon domain-containing protein [Lysinibacillus louembei]WPK10407.1 zinc ribbon domain-containing protein [Lysinibacillus louembei]
METATIIKEIRNKNQLSQGAFSEILCVTRQAVSRWETGKTTPNYETLKTISKKFNVTINTLLGSPKSLICQCCGMCLHSDDVISKELDNQFNEDYCKWCYVDGEHQYKTMEEILNFLVPLLVEERQQAPEVVRQQLEDFLPTLKQWGVKEE